ncbi:MAG: DEAD/DEAH box helicase [Pseudomonadota bacterium]
MTDHPTGEHPRSGFIRDYLDRLQRDARSDEQAQELVEMRRQYEAYLRDQENPLDEDSDADDHMDVDDEDVDVDRSSERRPSGLSHESLSAALDALDEPSQLLLEVLSVASTELDAARLHRVVQHGALCEGLGSEAEVQRRLDLLARDGLIARGSGNAFLCTTGCHQLAWRQAVTRRDFSSLHRAVTRALGGAPLKIRYGARPDPMSMAAIRRELRMAIAQGDAQAAEHWLLLGEQGDRRFPTWETVLFEELCTPFDAAWLERLPAAMLHEALILLLGVSLYRLEPDTALVDEALRRWRQSGGTSDDLLRQRLAANLLLQGRIEEARQVILGSEDGEVLGCAGWLDLMLGQTDSALVFFEAGLAELRRLLPLPDPFFAGIAGLFCMIALFARGTPQDLERIERLHHGRYAPGRLRRSHGILAELAAVWRDPTRATRQQDLVFLAKGADTLDLPGVLATLVEALATCWTQAVPAPELLTALATSQKRCDATGLCWLGDQLADMLLQLAPSDQPALLVATPPALPPLSSLVAPRPLWQRTLEALAAIGLSGTTSTSRTRRLVWTLDLSAGIRLEARDQKRTARGRFSQGRRIHDTRTGNLPDEVDFLSPQDIEICRALKVTPPGVHTKPAFELSARAARALVGHPLVFWVDRLDQPIEVVLGRAELQVQRGVDGSVRLSLHPPLAGAEDFAIVRDGADRAQVIELDPRQRAIASILGPGLSLPAAAEQAFIEALSSTATVVDVQSEIDASLTGFEQRPADPRPRARIAFVGRDLRVEFVTRPLGDHGAAFTPGLGAVNLVASIDGQRVQTRRDLDEELRQAETCVRACPNLDTPRDGSFRWAVDDPQHSLELLAELRALGDAVVMEWSSEGRLRIRAESSSHNLRLRIGRANDWFTLSGELRVDEDLVLDMRRLLELTEVMPGRFVPLGDGEFLALSAQLRRQIDALRAFTQGQGEDLRFHALAAAAVEQAVQGAGQVERGADFGARLIEIETAFRTDPAVPVDLQLELRGYQVEGFAWLARLAAGGMGACLADDMGLGKTAQVLALLLERRALGPSLVVAPTTVCGTWRDQASRYAPALRLVQLGVGERRRTIETLAPGDVLLCSYSLLVREIRALQKVAFGTLVLDEAQAIKNASTKRWQAVATLQGQARVITTGTPVENHLDELWALFQFLNPGLLGSRESFARRFALPIERDKDRERLGHLKTLVAPYILRRVKQQVLAELPPRTDIELGVEMGAAERAHYEALRQRALTKLVQPTTDGQPSNHVRILAEITRLRRACSNPAMVSPDAGLPSCKLDACVELLEQLRDGGHRTLVFSQWIAQLTALQQRLDELGFAQLYLDGSTPVAERQQRIDAFQAGKAEVFLISLKAGGQGINLTAADYVVHVDPWWNPAVEDQASDRAHRIGQTRPVTVYRLIVQDSIEEKIVALHRDKRDLASQILAGGELAAKLSADELLDLIRASS